MSLFVFACEDNETDEGKEEEDEEDEGKEDEEEEAEEEAAAEEEEKEVVSCFACDSRIRSANVTGLRGMSATLFDS